MSRTYRNDVDWKPFAYGRYWTWEEENRVYDAEGWNCLGWGVAFSIDRRGRDRKPWHKPPKCFKVQNRREERSRINQAVRVGKEPPRFRRRDRWEWL